MKKLIIVSCVAAALQGLAIDSQIVGYMSAEVPQGSKIIVQPFGGENALMTTQTLKDLLPMAGEGDEIAWPDFYAQAKESNGELHWVGKDGTVTDEVQLPTGDSKAILYTNKSGETKSLTFSGEVPEETMQKMQDGAFDAGAAILPVVQPPSKLQKPEAWSNVTVKQGSNILTITPKGKPGKQNVGSLLKTAGEGDTIAWPGFQATAQRKGKTLHWVTRDGMVADGEILPHGAAMAVHYTRFAAGEGTLRIRGDVFVSP